MQVTPFNFEQYQVRTVANNETGEVLFVGKDVCVALGYADHTNAMKQHCRGVVNYHPIQDSIGRIQSARILTEADVLRLAVNSELPSAEPFERWVFEEVLPSIRKTGGYSMAKPKTTADLPDLVSACNALVASVDAKVLPKKDGAELIRAITLASFHGADVLMAASKQNHCSLNFSVV